MKLNPPKAGVAFGVAFSAGLGALFNPPNAGCFAVPVEPALNENPPAPKAGVAFSVGLGFCGSAVSAGF